MTGYDARRVAECLAAVSKDVAEGCPSGEEVGARALAVLRRASLSLFDIQDDLGSIIYVLNQTEEETE